MSTRRCSLCAVNYPVGPDYEECPICEGETSYFTNIKPHKDWKDRVEDAKRPKEAATNKVDLHRTERFRRAGLDLERAMVYAGMKVTVDGGYAVDLHEFEKLVADGCDPDTAARIVAPL